QGQPPSTSCNGQCAPIGYVGWWGPFSVWMGPENQAPQCKDVLPAPQTYFYGIAPPSTLACGTCTCAPSTGSCDLPATVTASADTCTDGGTGTTIELPSPWDGGCTGADAGPGSVQSVSVPSFMPSDAGCMAIAHSSANGTPAATVALGCQGSALGACID